MGVTDQDSCTATKTKTLKCVPGPTQDQRVETSHPWRVVFHTLGAKDGRGMDSAFTASSRGFVTTAWLACLTHTV